MAKCHHSESNRGPCPCKGHVITDYTMVTVKIVPTLNILKQFTLKQFRLPIGRSKWISALIITFVP